MSHSALIVLVACMLEAGVGYPAWLFARIGHPVVWIGIGIAFLERNCNRPHAAPALRRVWGCVCLLALLAVTAAVAHAAQRLGWLAEMAGIAALMASRSLYDHVRNVFIALIRHDLELARHHVGLIVGRDTAPLDKAGIVRAAIESLAESFSDGVAAPFFWAACFGLPGIACYKAINTADSMIGHRDERYGEFGWASARLDDAVNFVPARLSALLLVIVSGRQATRAWRCVWRDAKKSASPNAGWPEAAMAGALDVQLCGPQVYDGVEHQAAFIGSGIRQVKPTHLHRAMRLYVKACIALWLTLALPALIAVLY